MENNLIYPDNALIEQALKEKQRNLAIHGIGMVFLSVAPVYLFGLFLNLDHIGFWLSTTYLSYDWQWWVVLFSANLFLLPRLLFLYRSYKAKLYGDKKHALQYRLLWLLVFICNTVLLFASDIFLFRAVF